MKKLTILLLVLLLISGCGAEEIVEPIVEEPKPEPIKIAAQELAEYRAGQDQREKTMLDSWCKEKMNNSNAVSQLENGTSFSCYYEDEKITIEEGDTPETPNIRELLRLRRLEEGNDTYIFAENITSCYIYCVNDNCKIEGLCTENMTKTLGGML